MKSSDRPHSDWQVTAWKSVYVMALGIGIYYVVTRAFPLLNVSEEQYGGYFFPRAAWLLPHVIGGIVATVIGPFQFMKKFREANYKRHRLLGRIYLLSIFFAGMTAFYLAGTSDVNLTYMLGLSGLGMAWIGTSAMAFLSIRRKKVNLHKEWMIRSYVVTFAFTTFRFFEDLLLSWNIGTDMDRWTLMSWACWAIPLFLTEVILQGRKL